MKIITRAPVEQASGKQGQQLVFMLWRNMQVAREYANPTNPSTADQVTVRAYLSAATKRWKTLTSGQRSGWQTYATNNPVTNSLGVSVRSTALGMYVKCNLINLMRTEGVTYVDTAPTASRPSPITAAGATATLDGDINITLNHGYTTLTNLFVMAKIEILASVAVTPRVDRQRMAAGPNSDSFGALATSGSAYGFTDGTGYSVGDEVGLTYYIVDNFGQTSTPFTIARELSAP
jgi:hypothetical protein